MDHSGERMAYRKTGRFVERAQTWKGLTENFVNARLGAKSRDASSYPAVATHSLQLAPAFPLYLKEFRGSSAHCASAVSLTVQTGEAHDRIDQYPFRR